MSRDFEDFSVPRFLTGAARTGGLARIAVGHLALAMLGPWQDYLAAQIGLLVFHVVGDRPQMDREGIDVRPAVASHDRGTPPAAPR